MSDISLNCMSSRAGARDLGGLRDAYRPPTQVPRYARNDMLRPKKKWGQNFLRNRGAVEKIVAALEPQPGETIVEIGPGGGVLTEKLAELPNQVIAIEIDPELAARLRSRFSVAAGALVRPTREGA